MNRMETQIDGSAPTKTIIDEALDDGVFDADSPYETEYETGQDNVELMGFDLHNPVFFLSAGALIPFIIISLLFPERMGEALATSKSFVTGNFDWFFVITTNFILLFCLLMAVSPMGKIKLGGDDATPDFSTGSWIAMLFSAGVGTGMMFYGTAEPAGYFTDWSGIPFNTTPLTAEAERLAFSATIFHWGLTPWAVYGVVGLALAFFTFNKGLPLTIRSAFYPLLGERTWGWPGHVIDLFAVLATIFGLATTLGMGATLAMSGLSFLFGFDNTLGNQILLIIGITSLAIISVVRGLDGGIKVLSNLNIVLAIGLLAFVILAGPTMPIVNSWLTNTVNYAKDFIPLSNWMDRSDKDFFHTWTILYWAWWVAWSPFVGMFIARVSRGRTVRAFLTTVIIIPSIAGIIWFSSFGKTAIDQIQRGIGSLPGGIDKDYLVIYQTLENLPYPVFASILAIFLLVVFFVTSSDSGSLVVDTITAGGKLEAPVPQRIFWASIEGLVAIALLAGGGTTAISTLQNGVITAGLPFTLILFVCCISLYVAMSAELRSRA